MSSSILVPCQTGQQDRGVVLEVEGTELLVSVGDKLEHETVYVDIATLINAISYLRLEGDNEVRLRASRREEFGAVALADDGGFVRYDILRNDLDEGLDEPTFEELVDAVEKATAEVRGEGPEADAAGGCECEDCACQDEVEAIRLDGQAAKDFFANSYGGSA